MPTTPFLNGENFDLETARVMGVALHDPVGAGVFDPRAVRTLFAAFDGAWQSIKARGAKFSNEQTELVRETLARYIIEQARHSELDQRRLRDGALLHLAQSI